MQFILWALKQLITITQPNINSIESLFMGKRRTNTRAQAIIPPCPTVGIPGATDRYTLR